VTFTYDLLTPKLTGIIFGSRQTKIPTMVFLSFICFKLLNRQGFYTPIHRDLDLWSSVVNVKLRYQFWRPWASSSYADKDSMFKDTVTLTFDLLTSKSIGIIFGSLPTKIPIIESLSLTGVKLISGKQIYAPGHCDHDLWPTDPKINRNHIFFMTN